MNGYEELEKDSIAQAREMGAFIEELWMREWDAQVDMRANRFEEGS